MGNQVQTMMKVSTNLPTVAQKQISFFAKRNRDNITLERKVRIFFFKEKKTVSITDETRNN